ncbi:MAG: group 1 truncated hemoglobin [Planctomycetota bacterium]
MTQAVTTMYEKLGGEKAITAVVADFYQRVLADQQLKPFFETTDMERQKKHQVAFVSMALGGPKKYTGRSMRKAHEGRGITENHFTRVANHLSASLKAANVGEGDVKEVISTVATLKNDVVGH